MGAEDFGKRILAGDKGSSQKGFADVVLTKRSLLHKLLTWAGTRLKEAEPPLPNIKTEIRRFGFDIRGVSGAYGYDWGYCKQTVAPEP